MEPDKPAARWYIHFLLLRAVTLHQWVVELQAQRDRGGGHRLEGGESASVVDVTTPPFPEVWHRSHQLVAAAGSVATAAAAASVVVVAAASVEQQGCPAEGRPLPAGIAVAAPPYQAASQPPPGSCCNQSPWSLQP